MIISTVSNDAICRKAFGKENVAISALEAMMKKFAVDPLLNNPPHEAYIVSNVDVRNKRVRDNFLEAAANKHPNVKIVYYSKREEKDFKDGMYPGIDRVVVKATPQVLADVVYELVDGSVAEKQPIVSTADSVATYTPFTPKEFEEEEPARSQTLEETDYDDENPFVKSSIQETDRLVDSTGNSFSKEEAVEELVVTDLSEDTNNSSSNEVSFESDSALIDRINKCQKVGDLAAVTREITASEVVKDVIRENAKYANYEMRLRAIQEKIFTVVADTTICDGREKLNRIQALLRDGDPYRDENTSMIGKHLEMIIDTVVSKTREILDKRLMELNTALIKATSSPQTGGEYARLSGIMDARANIMLELVTMEEEIKDMYVNLDKTESEIAENMAKKASRLANSPLIDSHLNAISNGETISKESLDAIVNVLQKCDKSSEEFQAAVRDISIMIRKLNKLLDLDRDAMTNLTSLMKLLRANNVEDTIVANTVLKSVLRIVVGREGAGKTAIPLIVARTRSRQNCNVLYLDLTGTSKAEDYGEHPYSIADWMEHQYQEEFVAVSGKWNDTPENAQRLLATLMKVADYFRAIYIVIAPEQETVLHTLQPDTLVVNYIMEMTSRDASFYKDFMRDTQYENVGRRIILNKCSVDTQAFLERLGVLEDFNVQLVKVPYLPMLASCSLHSVKPYEIDSIREELREVIKVC